MEARVLRLNPSGQPIEWLNWQDSVCLLARELVCWSLGGIVKRARGGFSRFDGRRTVIEVPSIIACYGDSPITYQRAPALTSPALFIAIIINAFTVATSFPMPIYLAIIFIRAVVVAQIVGKMSWLLASVAIPK